MQTAHTTTCYRVIESAYVRYEAEYSEGHDFDREGNCWDCTIEDYYTG